MTEQFFIIKSFGLFFRYNPLRISLLFLVTLVLGFTQGISLVLLVPLLGLLNADAGTAAPDIRIPLMDALISQMGIQPGIGLVLAVFTLCLLAVAALTALQSLWQAAYQQDFSCYIRAKLFRKIITADWKFLRGKSRHSHVQLLTAEIPKMATYYYYYLGLAGKLIFIFSHLILAFAISVRFTLLVLVFALLVFLALRRYLQKAEWLGNANIQTYRQMLKHIDEFWSVVKVAKIHHAEEFYFNKFDETNTRMRRYQDDQVKSRVIPQLFFSLSGVFLLVAVVYLAYHVMHIALPFLFVLILLFARIFPRFATLNNDFHMMVSNTSSVRMVLKADRELEEHDFKEDGKAGTIPLSHQLTIRNLSFGYENDDPLFINFSATIPARQITGIIGESGSGKTTLIDIISGLIRTDEPVVTADNILLSSKNFPAWQSSLGYLPQDPFFIDGTLRENLVWDSAYPAGDEQIMAVLRQVNAEHLVLRQEQGLDTRIVNYQYHFSGGERQRLALARVLLRKPQLLLLDEATSSLDPENEARIMECLSALKTHLTIVFVSHHQNLQAYFDHLILIKPPVVSQN
jgi:ATP-binding cassette subfamily C protein